MAQLKREQQQSIPAGSTLVIKLPRPTEKSRESFNSNIPNNQSGSFLQNENDETLSSRGK
jgi:hypothetical protein